MSKWYTIQGAKYYSYAVEVRDDENEEDAVEAAFSLGETLDEYEIELAYSVESAKRHADEVFPLE